MTFQTIRLTGIVLLVVFLLLIPFIAMKFTAEVNWTASDFVTAGVLLLSTGLICEFVMRYVTNLGQRIALCGIVLLALFLVWAELAVGLFGTRFAGS